MSTIERKLVRENLEAFKLGWDTEFFAVSSARAILKGSLSRDERDLLKTYIKDFEFVTITNSGNDSLNNYWLGTETSAFFTDMNTQFTKSPLNNCANFDKVVSICEAFPYNEKVLEIAKNAFKYSRFYNDPNIPAIKAENIYIHWTRCAFNRPGRFFSVAKKQKDIAGFLLFSIDKEKSVVTIELIAVDQKFQGQSVGRTLVASVETYAHDKGLKVLKVGTQIDNVKAIRFYTSCGFEYIGCNSIYHCWPKNNKLG